MIPASLAWPSADTRWCVKPHAALMAGAPAGPAPTEPLPPHPERSDRNLAIGLRGPSRNSLAVLVLLLGIGLGVRGLVLVAAPDHAFLSDHVDYMAWSAWAWERGAASLYDFPAGSLINVRLPPWLAGRPVVTPFPAYSRCNYPPLSIYACWLQGALWAALDPRIVCRDVLPEIASEVGYADGPVCSRVANTFKARLTNALLPVLADILLAAGVARLVGRLTRPESAARLSLWAFGITFLAPPLFLNSAFWTQTDAWLACGLVWTTYALVVGRHGVAGLLYAAALLTKPQAILFAPAVAWALLGRGGDRCVARGRSGRTGRFLAAMLLTGAVLALPFSLGGAGQPEGGFLRWAYRSYVDPVLRDFPYTTLKAFNIWWLDFVGRRPGPEALAAEARIGVLTRDQLGRSLFVVAIAASCWLCFRYFRWAAAGWPVLAFLVLLAAFVFPTRVHERYIYYCLPFAIASGAILRRLRLPVAILLVVGTFEMTWNLWYAPAYAAPWDPPAEPAALAWSAILAILSIAAYSWAVLAVARYPRPESVASGAL